MIKAILIDDEPLARSIIIDYLKEYNQIEIVQECNDGFEAIKAINEHRPDLIFLDIQMPKISGFELLEVLENPPAVIFTTAFEEYALKAFEQHAIDYLLKPISKSRFQKAMDKYLSNPISQKNNTQKLIEDIDYPNGFIERVLIKRGSSLKVIPTNKIIYLAADDDYVNIHTDEGSYLSNKTLMYFEKNLDPTSFVRVHRSFIIQIDQIQRLEPYEKDSHRAILKNEIRVSVSKTGYPKLMKALGN
ncbi:MAG TPA: LytTR family transcriptional regulator DNA-binding domain-containing protein [Sphingobacteriaceae bacterium]|nr:LytTR family transcriptional regulator DNA-binding domain-containing protein [Sphingobacteriaceae bacterium]